MYPLYTEFIRNIKQQSSHSYHDHNYNTKQSHTILKIDKFLKRRVEIYVHVYAYERSHLLHQTWITQKIKSDDIL